MFVFLRVYVCVHGEENVFAQSLRSVIFFLKRKSKILYNCPKRFSFRGACSRRRTQGIE